MQGSKLGVSQLIFILLCLFVSLGLSACQPDATPTPLPPSTSSVPTATREAVLRPLTPEATPASTPSPTPEPTGGTVILWHSWTGADADALGQILSAFQAANPDIQVETLFVGYNRLAQAFADAVYSGGGPDLILAPSWWLGELVESEVLAPLDTLMDPAMMARFQPAALDNMRYAGKLYGLPIHVDLISLYYNRTLIANEMLPATTDDLLALAQADPRQGAGLYAIFYHMSWGIPAYGGRLFDETGRMVLDETPATADFLGWLVAMNKTPGVFVDSDYGMLIDRFKKGEFAFFLDGTWSLVELQGALGDALDVTLIPAGPAGPARPWLSADGVLFNPHSSPAQQRMALVLADHLTSAESGTTLAEVASRLPANVNAQIDNPLLLKFLAQATNAQPEPHNPEIAAVWGYAGDMLMKVLGGVMSPAEAVREATALINEANNR